MATAIQVNGESNESSTNRSDFTLCIKEVPKHVPNDEIKRVLEKYGPVSDIVGIGAKGEANRFPYRFANLPTKKSQDDIIQGMANDKSGWVVEIKKKSSKKSSNSNSTYQTAAPQHSTYNLIYNCFNCGRNAKLCCERCEEIYCSKECQDKDWPKHKYACFKKPLLKNISNCDISTSSSIHHERTDRNMSKISSNSNNIDRIDRNISKIPSNSNNSDRIERNMSKVRDEKNVNKNDNSIVKQNSSILARIANKSSENNENDSPNKRRSTDGEKHLSRKEDAKFNSQENNTSISVAEQLNYNNIVKAPFPTTGEKIVLTHFEQLNRLFARSLKKAAVEEYIATIKHGFDSAEESKYLTAMPKLKDMVLSQFEGDWYRAVVLHPQDHNSILVSYIDFGNSDTKKLSDLKEMHPDCYKFQRHPILLTLKDIPSKSPTEINSKCKQYLQTLIDKQQQLKVVYDENDKDNKVQLVELYDYESNQSINEKIKELIIPPSVQVEAGQPVFLRDIDNKKFSPAEDVELIVIENSFIEAGCITCILSKDKDQFEDIIQKMTIYAAKDPTPYEPCVHEVCLVKYAENPDIWARASCESIEENGRVEVLFTDIGNISDVHIKNIRKYPSDCELPVLSNNCFLKGLKNAVLENEINEEFKSILCGVLKKNKTFVVPKVELIEKENYITLPYDIIKTIKSKMGSIYDEDE